MKKSPHWSLLHAFKLSKIESNIEHLLSWAHQKSMRLYHNAVSRHHPTKIVWQHSHFGSPLFRVLYNGSHQYQKYLPPPSISHLQ